MGSTDGDASFQSQSYSVGGAMWPGLRLAHEIDQCWNPGKALQYVYANPAQFYLRRLIAGTVSICAKCTHRANCMFRLETAVFPQRDRRPACGTRSRLASSVLRRARFLLHFRRWQPPAIYGQLRSRT